MNPDNAGLLLEKHYCHDFLFERESTVGGLPVKLTVEQGSSPKEEKSPVEHMGNLSVSPSVRPPVRLPSVHPSVHPSKRHVSGGRDLR